MSETALPRWDMTTVFPSLDSEEFDLALNDAVDRINDLEALFDEKGVRRRETPETDEAFARAFEEVTDRLNDLFERTRVLGSYINCFVTTDASDELAQAKQSLLSSRSVKLDQLYNRYIAWVGTSDADRLLALSETARAHEYPLRRAQEQARHQMPEGEEALAAELRPSGLSGWARLHGNLTALLAVTFSLDGEEKTLPMSAVRSLATHPRRETRRAAFEAELTAWETAAVPLAAALNGIKGFQRVLHERRGYESDVEPTLLANSIDRPTLDAMQAACVESFPDFRRYMAAKAKALGLDRLAWYDLSAPVGAMERSWSWEEAEAFIRENFAQYSSRMAGFAERAFMERWIDAGPRVGKEGGAYCTGIRPGESRVFMNFDGSFNNVSTLAHELGHAYHNLNMIDRKPLQRRSPSTLNETASIFCETLAFNAALQNADRDERIALFDTALQRDLQVVVDIHSRFLFEKAVFERRADRDLTIQEFCELMTDAQRRTYGEDVTPLHPYMWAVKGHYYGPTFYNYPYTFGLLFGLGLYAHYQREPEAFKSRYDEFLSNTGLADAKTLAGRFGLDVTSIDFWRSSLDVIRREIEEFEGLVS